MAIAAPLIEHGKVTAIALGKLEPDPDQPRKSFDEKALEQLAESIKVRVRIPLLVRPGKCGKLTIVDGERRWRAAKLAKLKALPCLLFEGDASEQGLRGDQLAVNQLREQLRPMETARVLSELTTRHLMTANDLAAYLDREGLPAMNPQQIRAAIALVDLPEWAQAMIDAGELEASAAAPLHLAARYPQVLAVAQKNLKQDAEWGGRVTASEVKDAVNGGFRQIAVDLTRTDDWNSDPVLFNPAKACKGCEHLVKLDRSLWCMHREGFEAKQAEAKEAGLLPGGKKPPKAPKPGTKGAESAAAKAEEEALQKQERRGQTLRDKVRDYLHAYLVQRLVERIPREIDIDYELLTWHAMRRPGENGPRAALPTYKASTDVGIRGLEDLFSREGAAYDVARKMAVVEIATELRWRETQVVCHQLWGTDVAKVWTMDDAFAGLFRKAELAHLAVTYQLELPEGKRSWDALKAGALRAEILAQADKMPAPHILQEIYQEVDKPHVPWSEREDGEDEELFCAYGVLDCEGPGTEQACEQCQAEADAA